MKTKNKNTITVPKETLKKLVRAIGTVVNAHEQLEDYFILSDKKIITDIARERLDHQKGRVDNWRAIKNRYGV